MRRFYLRLCLLCLAAFIALVYLGNNFYEETPNALNPAGHYILFHKPLPEPLGYLFWVAIKPLLLISLVAAIWFGIRAWQLRHRPGFCRKCGYDLRASTGRCPECGSLIGDSSDATT